jgi:hypothetical protein
MAEDRKKPGKGRPDIWASGGQRPPFDLRALGRASLFLSRDGMAPLQAWAARTARRAAINVRNGAGRIPADKLGRAARFVPSHLRVAAWIKNLAATLAHASATADTDVKRGNALVAEIEPHLWDSAPPVAEPAPPTRTPESPAPEIPAPEAQDQAPPVILQEPVAEESDPLASIRDDLAGRTLGAKPAARVPDGPVGPPAPPGAVAVGAMQVIGYLIGWASIIAALPYGLARALWLYASGRDLRGIGAEE